MPKNKKSSKNIKKVIGVLVTVIIIAGATFSTLYFINRKTEDNSAKNDGEYNAASELNDEDPNKDNPDKYSQGDDNKEKTDAEQNNSKIEKDEDGKKKAVVAINFAGRNDDKIEAGAAVTNLVETDGQCYFVFTSPSGKETKLSKPTIPNAKSTPCESASITGTETGTWSVSVRYTSDTATGESETTQFEVK